MKKLALGCLVLVVLLAIGAGVGSYFLYRKAHGMYENATAYVSNVSKFNEIPEIEKQIRNTSAFTPPASGELTPALVERYMNVQRAIQQKMGARADALDAKYKALEKAGDNRPSISEGLGALKDLAGLVVEAKRVQVDALNAQSFSKAEYEWTQRTIYEAMGVPVTTGGLAHAIETAAQGAASATRDEQVESSATSEVLQHNRALIEPYRKELEKNVGLAFFGL